LGSKPFAYDLFYVNRVQGQAGYDSSKWMSLAKEVIAYSQETPEHACREEKLPEGKVVSTGRERWILLGPPDAA